jgi:TolA-binding protein
MKSKIIVILFSLWVVFLTEPVKAETDLTELVKVVQPSVATVVAYDVDQNVANIGTGFFVNKNGYLITNYHVLVGKFGAEIKTADGSTYPIKSVVAENQTTDLIKVRVDIPPEKVHWIKVSAKMPPVAQRVMVVGSPMGLEHSVSDGIVSSVREIPGVGIFFQMSAPISPGSSGSPVVNMEGKVVGVATFQFLQGQNLNFAISGKSILDLKTNKPGQTLSEWTYSQSNQKPSLAGEMCRKGFSFSVNGQDQKALQYFKKAAENDPNSTTAWYGLGYCYAGSNSHNDAIAAYKQAIRVNPDFATAHFAIGRAYLNQGDKASALDQYKILKKLDIDIANRLFEEIYH